MMGRDWTGDVQDWTGDMLMLGLTWLSCRRVKCLISYVAVICRLQGQRSSWSIFKLSWSNSPRQFLS